MLIGGNRGAGKSNPLNLIVAHAAKSPDAELVLIDANRVQLAPWAAGVRRFGGGTFYVTREVWPIMVERRYGRIVVTTSGNGLLGNPASVSYSIAKAGVYGMMRSIAIDGVELGIKATLLPLRRRRRCRMLSCPPRSRR